MTNTCLIVIDAQESFRHRPYSTEADMPAYLAAQNALIEGMVARGLPVVRVLHTDGPDRADNPFSLASGHVVPLRGLVDFAPAASFLKRRHSALVGTGLDVWLTENGIRRIIISGIRSEQCCETTTRHASDLGWEVDYVVDATHTYAMVQPDGQLIDVATLKARTATVLADRFATLCSVAQALERAASAAHKTI
ncbi:MAG: hydrolase [Burkholderiales bacterium PBB4]|nr:MAG: hydrolase [Burkholderiales bacterium PBB4]